MTNIIVGIRGSKKRVEEFINDAASQFWPYKCKNEKGEWRKDANIKLNVQPIQLFSIACAEDQVMNVLKTLKPHTEGGYQETAPSQIIATMIRKALKLDTFPTDEEIDKGQVRYIMDKYDIDIVGVGIKKDIWKDGVEQI